MGNAMRTLIAAIIFMAGASAMALDRAQPPSRPRTPGDASQGLRATNPLLKLEDDLTSRELRGEIDPYDSALELLRAWRAASPEVRREYQNHISKEMEGYQRPPSVDLK